MGLKYTWRRSRKMGERVTGKEVENLYIALRSLPRYSAHLAATRVHFGMLLKLDGVGPVDIRPSTD